MQNRITEQDMNILTLGNGNIWTGYGVGTGWEQSQCYFKSTCCFTHMFEGFGQ